jgi:hypothetical protein
LDCGVEIRVSEDGVGNLVGDCVRGGRVGWDGRLGTYEAFARFLDFGRVGHDGVKSTFTCFGRVIAACTSTSNDL